METFENYGFKECKLSFDEFIDVIRPENKMKLGGILSSSNHDFIYRGQPNSIFELVPSLYRNTFEYSEFSKTYNDLCFIQRVYLKTFVKGCDANAVAIPNDSYEFRNEYLENCHDTVFLNPTSWPDKKLYELLAFAQHYGYPTELLDWTYNPLVACYFAATGVINDKQAKIDGSFSIWVLDKEKKNLLNRSEHRIFDIIDVPRAHNINISSQEGCFTLVRQDINLNQNLTHKDNKISELKLITDLMHNSKTNGLLKLTISNSVALKLIEFCEDYSINAATLFRGPYGAAQYAMQAINASRFAKTHGLSMRGSMVL